MANIVPKCPNCSAPLKADQQRHSYSCAYCQTQIFDATLKEAENEALRMELQRKEAENEARRIELAYERRKEVTGSLAAASSRESRKGKMGDPADYCRVCGTQIAGGTAFCPACGTPAGQATQQPVIVNVYGRDSYGGHGDYPFKSKWAAFFLCLMFGWFGVHRFYVGKTGTGVLWLMTAGFFGIGWTIDLILILVGAFTDKAGYPLR